MATSDVYAASPGAVRGLRVSEYDVLVDARLFDDEWVELLEGALVTAGLQAPAHAERRGGVAPRRSADGPGACRLEGQEPDAAGRR